MKNQQSDSTAKQQIILFDVDGVLIHGYHARPALRQCWDEHLLRDFGIDRERFKKEFIDNSFVKNILIGTKDLYEELAISLPKLGYNGDVQLFIDYWLEHDSRINTSLIEKIKLLKENNQVRLFIATNQEHNRAQFLMKNMGFGAHFEDIFYSARMGAAKPNYAFFDWITSHLHLTPAQKPIFFDDTPTVIEAAKKHGWEAIEYVEPDDLNKSQFIKNVLSQCGRVETSLPQERSVPSPLRGGLGRGEAKPHLRLVQQEVLPDGNPPSLTLPARGRESGLCLSPVSDKNSQGSLS